MSYKEPNYKPKQKVPYPIRYIYTRHEYVQQLKGNITWFYKKYIRKRHLFKKDEWIFVEELEEDKFNRQKLTDSQIMLPGYFEHYNLVLEGEGYCDVGWD